MNARVSDASIEELAPWWRRHARADFGPFGLPEWALLYRRNFSSESELLLLEAVADEGEREAIIPLERYGDGRLCLVGGSEVTDYALPVMASGAEAETAAALAGWLAAEPGEWASVSLEAMPADTGFGALIEEASVSAGLVAERYSDEICAVIDLPSDFDTYLESLTKKERHEFKRKWRRFEREIGEASLIRCRGSELDAGLEEFFTWHRAADGEKGGFMNDRMEGFFTDLATTFDEMGLLRFEFVEAGGEHWAAGLGFCDGERYYGYNSAFRQDARAHSPGMAMLWLLLGELLTEGVNSLDFLQGDERYKFQLGSRARPLETVRITKP